MAKKTKIGKLEAIVVISGILLVIWIAMKYFNVV